MIRVVPFHRSGVSLSAYDPEGVFLRDMDLGVLAVIHANRMKAYLVYYRIPGVPRALEWLEEKYVKVVSDERPLHWIEKRWPHWHRLRKSNRDYEYKVSYYAGPPEILEDDHFLFDIYESQDEAFRFLEEHGII